MHARRRPGAPSKRRYASLGEYLGDVFRQVRPPYRADTDAEPGLEDESYEAETQTHGGGGWIDLLEWLPHEERGPSDTWRRVNGTARPDQVHPTCALLLDPDQ